MSAITSAASVPFTNASPSFGCLLKSEWSKLRSIRSTWVMFGLAIGLSITFSAVLAVVTGMTYDDMSARLQSEFDPILTTMGGWLFGMLLVIVLSATGVTAEYNNKMIRTSLIVTPRRSRVFAAKAIVTGAFGMSISAIVIPGMFLICQPIYSHYGLETASVTDHDVIRFFIIGGLLQGLYHAMASFSIAWLLRGTASAVTAAIGFSVLPWMITPIVPLSVREHVIRYLPDNAKDSLLGQLEPGASTYVNDSTALIIIATWLIVLMAAAVVALNRRDV